MTNHKFRPKFTPGETLKLAQAYPLHDPERRIEETIRPAVRARGYLTKAEFQQVCKWKTPRTAPKCATNDAGYIKDITGLALTTPNERLRIECLTLLTGVSWPTASVFLHWFHPAGYPILDFRALWSLGVETPRAYDFRFWTEYTEACRRLAKERSVALRELDRALWQYSKDKQRG